VDHNSLDCAVIQPAKNGTWVDKDCSSGVLGLSYEDRYFGFCEFGANPLIIIILFYKCVIRLP